jgi:hypothetical protein
MINRLAVIGTIVALLAAAVPAVAETFKARLSGAEEVPPVTDQGIVYANVHSIAKPGGVVRGQIESNHH